MAKKKRTILAISPDGGLYVETAAVMNPFIALMDGLSMTVFGNEEKTYLKVDDAIAWLQKERQHCRRNEYARSEYEMKIEVLEKFKKQQGVGQPPRQTRPCQDPPGSARGTGGETL